MRVFVSVKSNYAQERLVQEDETHFTITVKDPPIDGRANKAVVAMLAEYFGVPKSQVELVGGATSRKKVFDIMV